MGQASTITVDEVKHWSDQAVEGWLTGHTDFDDLSFDRRFWVMRSDEGSFWFTERTSGLVLGKFLIATVAVEVP